MRPVLRFPPLTDAGLAAPMELSAPSSPTEDLVFPFDAEGSQRTPLPYEQSAAAAFESIRQLDAILEPAGDAQSMLARHVELACGGAHRVDPAALAAVLQRLGYSAKLHDSACPLYKFKAGVRHQYISVCLPDAGCTGLETFVVDPNFKDTMSVAHPTPRYAALLDSLPAAVVASKPCLHRAVGIVAREMARSFADQGSDLPPWRTHQALLSKWHLGGAAASSSTADGAGCSAWHAAQGFPAAAGQLFGGGKVGAD
ncbi:hypothetical protein C2E21_2841 [Chlorella sorokiniana]|jgi:uncharacterized protein (TIGR01615 family)|uniref:Uncharacterized protein n=1 Tax=Chlorella sorokiniana TaxID=3076 RepID=A0A2P6TWU5_CHLSO|nr:hypothetical protein C2E21_2841 [Chlorella sorokiniana]|eukprot:PRW58535.1 hypothetical protein C2E21_2841 [Chlorella sorokiniana]